MKILILILACLLNNGKVTATTISDGQWLYGTNEIANVIEEDYYANEEVIIVGVDGEYAICDTSYGERYIHIEDLTDFELQELETLKVKITSYCSACNSPKNSRRTASGIPAYIGSCAMNGVPFGTIIHTSLGDFVVIDRVGKKGIVDIWMGDFDSCRCSYVGYYFKEEVTVDCP